MQPAIDLTTPIRISTGSNPQACAGVVSTPDTRTPAATQIDWTWLASAGAARRTAFLTASRRMFTSLRSYGGEKPAILVVVLDLVLVVHTFEEHEDE